jgi:adenosylcobinamide-GDP ribazoletransferase
MNRLRIARAMNGLRIAVAMFTIVPVPRAWHDRQLGAAPAAMTWLPFVGAALGALAGCVAAGATAADARAALLGAVLAVGATALLTRGLHLDGLADTADGLASRRPAPEALQIMRRPDIGPFGVATLCLVLLADVSAVAVLAGQGRWLPVAGLAVACATGRVAAMHAALPRVPAARADGFGALVAGRGGYATTAAITALGLAGGAGIAALTDGRIWVWPLVQVVALGLAALACRHAVRRLGGATGDVFGALIETATMVSLVGLALFGQPG